MHRKLPLSGDICISLCICGHVYVNILHIHGSANKKNIHLCLASSSPSFHSRLVIFFITLAQMSVQEVSLLGVQSGNHV